MHFPNALWVAIGCSITVVAASVDAYRNGRRSPLFARAYATIAVIAALGAAVSLLMNGAIPTTPYYIVALLSIFTVIGVQFAAARRSPETDYGYATQVLQAIRNLPQEPL